LHNMWSELTLRDLFRQLDRGQALLDQLGSGTNIELAMQVLLLGFTANEGRM
jgi:hypothetical protein